MTHLNDKSWCPQTGSVLKITVVPAHTHTHTVTVLDVLKASQNHSAGTTGIL